MRGFFFVDDGASGKGREGKGRRGVGGGKKECNMRERNGIYKVDGGRPGQSGRVKEKEKERKKKKRKEKKKKNGKSPKDFSFLKHRFYFVSTKKKIENFSNSHNVIFATCF